VDRPVIAIFGPTGVGKTAVALELADLLRGDGENPVAISADALQVYAGLGALTGAATPAEQARLEHRLIGHVPVDQPYSVGDYMPAAHAEIDAALDAGRTPIVVGGTGLYLRAALADLSLEKRGPDEESELWSADTRHPTVLVALTLAREELYRRIDARVDAIVAAGAEAEVRAVAQRASHTARKALGFDQLLRGDVEDMRRRSRHYARRQLTWMRKMAGAHVVDVTGTDDRLTAEEVRRIVVAAS
jgi:tRNA dimethylallyltransferase